MAEPVVTSPTPPPEKVESDLTLPPAIGIEQEDKTQNLAIVPSDVTQSEKLQSPPPTLPAVYSPPIPHFIASIDELRQLSDALSAFYRCYDDLQSHIKSVEFAIDSQLNLQSPRTTPQPREIHAIVAANEPTSANPAIPMEEASTSQQWELEFLCRTMSGDGLREYMLTHLGEANKLRDEVPKALKVASNPARLVLDSVGKFYLQRSKAYKKDSSLTTAREASVLTLECFLLAQDDDVVVGMDKEIKEEADKATIAWRKRLLFEGGLANASEIDARGLLMFIGCYGFPSYFKDENVKDLFQAGNVKEISSVLKRSKFLVAKILDLIDSAMKMKMTVDAFDIAYTFGFEDKLPPHPVLPTFLRDARASWKRNKSLSQGSILLVNEANKKYLSAYQSVIKCLERHNIDLSEALPGWKIDERVKLLEKDILDLDQKITENKRRADDRYLRKKEAKHFRNVDKGLPQHQLPAQLDNQRRFLGSVHGPPVRALASPSLMHGTGVGRGMREAEAHDQVPVGAPYTGYYGEGVAFTAGQTGSYGGQHFGANSDRLPGTSHTYAGQPPAYGHVTVNGAYNGQPEATRHTYAGQPPAYGLPSIYRPSPT